MVTVKSLASAVPKELLKATSKPPSTSASSVTVKVSVAVPAPVPSVMLTSSMVKLAASSLLIVPAAESPVVITASCTAVVPVTSPRVMVKVSLSSTISSPTIVTEMACVSPAVPVKVIGLLVTAVRSVASAVPSVRLWATSKPPSTAASRITVKLTI